MKFVPSLLVCHCTLGVGVPEAVGVSIIDLPAITVWPVGRSVMIEGGDIDAEGGDAGRYGFRHRADHRW